MDQSDISGFDFTPENTRPKYTSERFFRILRYGTYKRHEYIKGANRHRKKRKILSLRQRRLKVKPSRSEAEFSFVLSMRKVGYSVTQIEIVFEKIASGHSKYLQEKPESRKKYLLSMIEKADLYIGRDYSRFNISLAERAYFIIMNPEFSNLQKSILIGLLGLCRITRKFCVTASVREIAMQCNMSIASVSKGIHQLQLALGRKSSANLREGAIFDLSNIPSVPNTPSSFIMSWNTVHLEIPLNHDLFLPGGLGYFDWSVLVLIRVYNRQIEDLLGIFPCPRRRLLMILRRLERLELIEKVKMSWRFLKGNLDNAAQKLGIAGKLSARAARYANDQFQFHERYWWVRYQFIRRALARCSQALRMIHVLPGLSPIERVDKINALKEHEIRREMQLFREYLGII